MKDKIYKKEKYVLGNWCRVRIVLFKNNMSGKYEVKLLAQNDLIKEKLRYVTSYDELKFASICYDNWRNSFIGVPKELEEEMGEPKLKEKYMETYKAL